MVKSSLVGVGGIICWNLLVQIGCIRLCLSVRSLLFFAKWKSLSFRRIALQSFQSHSLSLWLHYDFFSFPSIMIAYKTAEHFSNSTKKGKLRKNTNKRKHCVWDFPPAFNIRPDSIVWINSSPFPVQTYWTVSQYQE